MIRILYLAHLIFISNYLITNEIEKDFVHPIYANNFIGKVKVVCGKVKSTYLNKKSKSKPLYINFHKEYPFAPFTAIIWTKYTGDEFGPRPEKRFLNKKLCIKGLIEQYNGKPQIILRYSEQIID
tara:strand:+ start:1522 stop:1896 length:375 start_codon:yes stop_codon:yes gene_type:complete